jgi:hypothetical protein
MPAPAQQPSPTASAPGASRTPLPDGRVLVLGGTDAPARAQLSDPRTGQTTTLSAQPSIGRTGHSATLLPSGRVLILGGKDADGQVIVTAEVFDPGTGSFSTAGDLGLLARADHTALMLSDGRLLIAGGIGPRGELLDAAELYDPVTGEVALAERGPLLQRAGGEARLLPDGSVLMLGGTAVGELGAVVFDPATLRARPVSQAEAARLLDSLAGTEPLRVMAWVPPADEQNFEPDGLVIVRFSRPIDLTSANAATITLLGPTGAVAAQVVPSQDGMLAFVTPDQPLLPGAPYTLFVQGVRTGAGEVLAIEGVNFATRVLNPAGAGGPLATSATEQVTTPPSQPGAAATAAAPIRVQAIGIEPGDDEIFMPTAANHGGRWRTGRPLPKEIRRQINTYVAMKGSLAYEDAFKSLHDTGFRQFVEKVPAPAGPTVSGQVLRLTDAPLSGVHVTIGSATTETDAEGRFTLTGLAAGRHELLVDGTKAGGEGRQYAKFVFGVDVEGDRLTEIAPIYLPHVRPQDWISIPAPIQRELVITHPNVPGMEIHIPKGAVLRERDGQIVTKVALVPLPLDRVPFAFPANAPVYVSVQPGGMVVQGLSAQTGGIRVIYPNLGGQKPGTLADFWRYDPLQKGWYVYGQGKASADGRQVLPDPGVDLYDSIGFMYVPGGAPRPRKRAHRPRSAGVAIRSTASPGCSSTSAPTCRCATSCR